MMFSNHFYHSLFLFFHLVNIQPEITQVISEICVKYVFITAVAVDCLIKRVRLIFEKISIHALPSGVIVPVFTATLCPVD